MDLTHMKPSIRLVVALAGLACIAAVSASPLRANDAPAASVPCRAWSYNAESFRLYITDIDTSTADSAGTYRKFWSIPSVTSSDIALVRDDSLCDRAARIHAASIHSKAEPYPVFVLRVGPTRYIVFNFMSVGEYFDYTILDSALKVVAVRRSN
jgi:hypothetical protein